MLFTLCKYKLDAMFDGRASNTSTNFIIKETIKEILFNFCRNYWVNIATQIIAQINQLIRLCTLPCRITVCMNHLLDSEIVCIPWWPDSDS